MFKLLYLKITGNFFFENSFKNMSLDRGIVSIYDALRKRSIDTSVDMVNVNSNNKTYYSNVNTNNNYIP